tara:strand:- start:359 stop:1372 length:1014 start_codon:yes stop_codon:yes gene_type:complete
MRLILFFSILVISCGTNSLDYKIIIDSSDQILTKNSNIKLSVSEIDNKNDVSISFFLNDQVIDSNTNLNLARLGANEIVAEIIDSESNYIISKKIDIYNAYPPDLYSYKIINEYSHDISSYTQGLEFYDGFLYESTGLNGFSSLKKLDVFNSKVLEKRFLDNQYFGEGLTIINEKILQLTWKSKIGFIYDLESLEMLGSFNYENSIEGWGLANDGKNIFKSDGTERIWILDPKNFQEIDFIEVVTNNKKIKDINELEVVEDKIYANSWQFNNDIGLIIDKSTGGVNGVINFKGLREKVKQHPELDVLNGIAYNKERKTFFVTGKKWDKIFEIEIFKQ